MISLYKLMTEAAAELKPDGQLQINSVDDITHEQWGQISKLMLQRGYDSRGADDAKRAVTQFIERFGEPIIKHPHWAEVISHVLGLSRIKPKKLELPIDIQKKVMAAAIRRFGITNNLKLAGWILPNGKYLNFSHDGLTRDKDHSEMGDIISKHGGQADSHYAIVSSFCLIGAIRTNGEHGQIMIGKMPTPQQFHALEYLFHVNDGAIDLDMIDKTHGTTGRTYTKGTKPKRIYYDIVNFYKTGQGPRDTMLEIEYPMASGEDLADYGGMAGWKGKIVWMAPDKFLSLAYPLTHPIPQSLSRLEKRMRDQLPIDFLVLKVDSVKKKVVGHEGRHRATIAKKLGIEKVPVLVYFEEGYPRVPKWGPEHHDFADKAEFKPEWDKT